MYSGYALEPILQTFPVSFAVCLPIYLSAPHFIYLIYISFILQLILFFIFYWNILITVSSTFFPLIQIYISFCLSFEKNRFLKGNKNHNQIKYNKVK